MSGDAQRMSGSPDYLFRHEDILRAIGRYIDEHRVQDVVLLQLESGILLRGLQPSSNRSQVESIEQLFTAKEMIEHVFTDDDLKRIDEASKKQRGHGSSMFR